MRRTERKDMKIFNSVEERGKGGCVGGQGRQGAGGAGGGGGKDVVLYWCGVVG